MVGSLAAACATTVDGLIGPGGDGGRVPTRIDAAIDLVLEAAHQEPPPLGTAMQDLRDFAAMQVCRHASIVQTHNFV